MSKTKFWKGVLLGALAGGALSLFDRETRKVVMENCQKTTDTITYYAKHPKEAVERVKESTEKVRHTIEEVGEEVAFIAGKIDEMKEVTPQVTELVKETKQTFSKESNDMDDEFVSSETK